MAKDKKNGKQDRSKYSRKENIVYMTKKLWKWNKGIVACCILQVPLTVLLPLCGVYLPKVLVSEVERKTGVISMMCSIGMLTSAMIVLNMLQKVVDAKNTYYDEKMTHLFEEEVAFKAMDMDYHKLDRKSTLVKVRTAMENVMGGIEEGPQAILFVFASIVANVLGLFLYTGILSGLAPWIFALVFVTTGINYVVGVRVNAWIHEHQKNWLRLDNKLAYLTYNSSSLEAAKDIRLYQMQGWLSEKFTRMMKERIRWTVTMQLKYFMNGAMEAVSILLRDGIAYVYLIYLIVQNQISVSEFVLFFGIISGFSTWCSQIIKDFIRLNKIDLKISEYRDYVETKDVMRREGGTPIPEEKNGYEIIFEHVAYCYEGEDKATISDLNFTIQPGEKIAMVGANGAGKTTIVKLMCGLYSPTKGRVIVGGCDIREYNIAEYYRLFSPVFQDIRFLPVSLEKNITLCDKAKIDDKKLETCIQLSGLKDKIERLPKGLDTLLDKELNEEAVELSGGEEQKLMLAKSLYKDAPIMILDEPTAALDPIAENDMYLKYHELTKDKTSIFISHRLASTRFCDRILLIEDGTIIEDGTHEELLTFGGKYREMFEVQAKYYKEAKGDRTNG